MFHPRSEIPETSSVALARARPPVAPRSAVPHAHELHESSSDEETNIVPLVDQPQRTRQAGSWGSFWGRSSPMVLVENALSDLPPRVEDFRRPKFWVQPVSVVFGTVSVPSALSHTRAVSICQVRHPMTPQTSSCHLPISLRRSSMHSSNTPTCT